MNQFVRNCLIKSAGFSLLEVLLAVILLVIMGMGSMSMAGVMKNSALNGQDRVLAMQAMEKILYEYKAMSGSDVRKLPEGVLATPFDVPQLKKANGNPAQVEVFIKKMENDVGYRKIDLRVEWADAAQRIHKAYLTGVIYAE